MMHKPNYQDLLKAKKKDSTCRNSRTFEPSTRKMVSYPDSWQNSKNILPNICKISPALTSAIQKKNKAY